ncbi:C-type mannose receptor 2-like [Mya arenaria]|uniref:C-type mannose receptor 2-like n=1 Tax=Mya arenaria TaxID=6604 RepID=UPI0022E11E84|nr:C-type mannose receptor 2-like [Mya arenaria]
MCCQIPMDVYSGPSTEGVVLGRLCDNGIDLDCKLLVNVTVNQWAAILYQHQVAYIQDQAGVKQRDCYAIPMLGERLTTGLTIQTSATTPASKRKLTTATTPSTTATSMTLPTTTLQSLTTTIEMNSSTAQNALKYGCTTVYPHYGYTEAGTLFTINNTCYELNANLHTWRTANSMCNSKGGSLAYIDDRFVQDTMFNVLKSNLNNNVWIGLNILQHVGDFQWASGEKLSYTLWHSGYVGYNDSEDCVVMMASTPEGAWEDKPCAQMHGYICQFGGHSKYQTTSTTRPTTGLTDIPIGSVFSDGSTRLCSSSVRSFSNQYGTVLAQYGHSCYELLNTEVTWTYAETLCTNGGGHLIQISGQLEETYIQQFLLRHGSPEVWIGLNDRQTEGHMQWSSSQIFVSQCDGLQEGEPVNYEHCMRGHMDNIVGRDHEDGVVMFPQRGGHWDDVPCELQNGIVEKHVGIWEYRIQTSGSIIGK